MNRSLRLTLGLMFSLACLIPAGTIATSSSSSTPEASPVAGQRVVSVYFLREGRRTDQVGAAHRAVDVANDEEAARAAIEALIEGPNDVEKESGLSSTIPTDTEILDLTLDSDAKMATVDFSAEFAPNGEGVPVTTMAQVVYTLTQFAGIENAAISIDGQPFTMLDGDEIALDGPATRVNYDHTTPLIFLESPAPGDTISSPVRLWGTANTFEATFQAEVQDTDGNILVSEVVTATSGNGVRGTFDITLTFDRMNHTNGQVVVFERSARDGGVQNEVVIPVTFAS